MVIMIPLSPHRRSACVRDPVVPRGDGAEKHTVSTSYTHRAAKSEPGGQLFDRRGFDGSGRWSGTPWLVLMRQPHQLGIERKDPLPAFGGRLIELAEPHR